jgi:hypothetical protein
MSFPTWNPDWHPLPGQAVFDVYNQHIAAVSRAAGNLDLFVIGKDGRVWTNAWSEGANPATGGWNADWNPLPGQVVFSDFGHITAVSRAAGNLDLFALGKDGRVWTDAWSEGANPVTGGWNADWGPLPGQVVFNFFTDVAAVSRTTRNLNVFVFNGNDGCVWANAWTEGTNGGDWGLGWGPLPQPVVYTQQVTAVSRDAGNLDVFGIGSDGHVWTNVWTEGTRPATGGWNPEWRPLPGQATFLDEQRIAAVSLAIDNLELFVIGYDGRIWTNVWAEGGGGWNAEWLPLPGQAVFSAKQRIAAVSRAASNLDLFVIGNDGRLWTNEWSEKHR